MSRVKVPIVKIQNTTARQVVFSKRRSGLVKKAYEVSVLCDIDCVIIILSPSGKLTCFSNRRIEDVLIKFLRSSTSIPNKEDLMILLENLKTQDMARESPNQHSSPTSDYPRSCWDTEDIREEVIRLRKQLNSLKEITRFVGDIRKPNHSPHELKELDNKLLNFLDQVTKRKNYLLSRSATSTASLPITAQDREEASFPLQQKLEALQLTNKGKQPMKPPYGGSTGVIKKEKLESIEYE
ncbi:MADS-box transcription factor 58 [Carex littledalei]|uniref:MADS-box transcription factor 58 n=1 Tax=Carex littledalei TaxID=544730 RepID=A0A833RHE4_9POAL|nr:MADS-box transcription factor 58 [Carex littledalei]